MGGDVEAATAPNEDSSAALNTTAATTALKAFDCKSAGSAKRCFSAASFSESNRAKCYSRLKMMMGKDFSYPVACPLRLVEIGDE